MKDAKKIAASYARSFLAACLAQFIALGPAAFDLNEEGAKSILAAGLAAILPPLLRWLNPNDPAFGRSR